MPRALHRFHGTGDLHFITFSCYQRQPLLDSAPRRDLFLHILERVRRRYCLIVLGYVVMPEHVHLLLSEPQRATLSTAIQALKLGFIRCSYGYGDNLIPRSRKGGETWGTPLKSKRFWQARLYDFNVWTERKRVEN
jgi:putative transposase